MTQQEFAVGFASFLSFWIGFGFGLWWKAIRSKH